MNIIGISPNKALTFLTCAAALAPAAGGISGHEVGVATKENRLHMSQEALKCAPRLGNISVVAVMPEECTEVLLPNKSLIRRVDGEGKDTIYQLPTRNQVTGLSNRYKASAESAPEDYAVKGLIGGLLVTAMIGASAAYAAFRKP